ncbi:MAG: hypothetical protein M3P08_05445 [Thermoproteota archaeon]|nr:hypothetical protein [Thermoproteota archaeon]
MNRTKLFFPGLIILANLLAGVYLYNQNTYAISSFTNPSTSNSTNETASAFTNPSTSNSTNETASAFANPSIPFQGKSILIFNVLGFNKVEQWNIIDNYVSHGYDIKGIISREDKQGHVTFYTVVLQTKR